MTSSVYSSMSNGIFMLGITTLHNGMIFSTLSISSRSFALGFPKGLITMEIVFFAYKLTIIPYTSLLCIYNFMRYSVRSHIGWREERNISYKDVETSP